MASSDRPLATRIRRLQEVTLRATEAPTIGQVARVIVDEGLAALEGTTGALWLVEGDMLELLQSSGTQPGPEYRRLPLSADAPLARAVATRTPLWFSSFDDYAAKFPSSAERLRQSGASDLAVACLPLATGDHVLGGIVFAFDGARELSEDERAFLVTIARQCASAIDRIRKAGERERLEAENAQGALRLRKLQEVTAALSSATTPADIAAAMVQLGAEAVEAASCSIWACAADGSLHVLAAHGSAACRKLCGEIVARDEEHWIEAPEAFAGLPLDVGGRAIAALVFGYAGAHRFPDDERSYLRALARHCEQALERAQLYVAEADARREAELASRTKDEFLAMLGHELRNPLAPIVTALQLMELRAPTELQRERAIIERQLGHVVRLVDDLLDVSRITRGKVELRQAPVELARVVAQAIEATSTLVEERGHRLTVDVPGTGLVVYGDFDRLAQVIGNLVINAAKYTPRGGRIAITAHRDGADACVRVVDSGIGLSAELLPHVFEMFVQGERTRDRAEGGLGLGLAIVKNLVELHGGRVTAASDGPGKGTAMSVWLPLAGEASATTSAAPELANDAPPSLRILVVDDNVDAAELLAELLRSMGYETDVAHDAGGALALAQQRPPSVALLDIGLPAVDGYELARRMREIPALATTPLVAITGYGQQGDRARSEAAGFAAHLVKPIGSRELRAALEHARH